MGFLRRHSWFVDCVVIFALASALIWPCYRLIYLDNWSSIEPTFIADGRMLLDNFPHRNWQPYWYCGTRADYVYPPGLRYGVAILTSLLNTSPPRAYHIFIAIFYALGIVAVYAMVRIGNGSRPWAWVAAIAVALLAPSFAFMKEYRIDSGFHAPQRLHVLMTYGEGPHMSALAIIPFVLGFAMLAFRTKHRGYMALAGFAAAVVVTNNFYGATALAILFPILAWAAAIHFGFVRITLISTAVAALAYGLTASWLTPSYLWITRRNLALVAQPGKLWSVLLLAGLAIAFAVVTWLLAKRWKADRMYPVFVIGAAILLLLYVQGDRLWGFRVAGEPSRLVPELDFILILLAVELLRLASKWNRYVVVAATIGAFAFSAPYLQNAWKELRFDHNWRDRPEYKTATWMHQNHPGKRALVTGSIRFWYNVWYDQPQVDGGSQQGLLNWHIALSQWRLFAGEDTELMRLWLQALAADIAVIPQKNSREPYHDVVRTDLWHSSFPLLRDDGEGNLYYRIQRRCEGTVRLVDAGRMQTLSPIPYDGETDALRSYVNAIEAEPPGQDGCGRVQARRDGTDAQIIEADVREGEALLVSETLDPYWRASSGGQPVPIHPDPLGFMLLRPAPGKQTIRLEFDTPREVIVGRALSVLALLATAALIFAGFRRRSSPATPQH
jgi:hypothetical protein